MVTDLANRSVTVTFVCHSLLLCRAKSREVKVLYTPNNRYSNNNKPKKSFFMPRKNCTCTVKNPYKKGPSASIQGLERTKLKSLEFNKMISQSSFCGKRFPGPFILSIKILEDSGHTFPPLPSCRSRTESIIQCCGPFLLSSSFSHLSF